MRHVVTAPSGRSTNTQRCVRGATRWTLARRQVTYDVPVWKGEIEDPSALLTADRTRPNALTTHRTSVLSCRVESPASLRLGDQDRETVLALEAGVIKFHLCLGVCQRLRLSHGG